MLVGPDAEFNGLFTRVVFAIPKRFGWNTFEAFTEYFPEKDISEVVACEAPEPPPSPSGAAGNAAADQHRPPRPETAAAGATLAVAAPAAADERGTGRSEDHLPG